MTEKFERVHNEVRDALGFGYAQGLVELAPMISALNKQEQERIVDLVVGALRVDFVRAMEPVQWKIENWKNSVVHHAAELGGVDIVRDVAAELDAKSLRYCLCSATANPTRWQLLVVQHLAPMVHAAKQPIIPAIRDSLLSVHYAERGQMGKSKQAAGLVLGELFRYERVDRALRGMLKDEGREQVGKMLPYLVEFIQDNLSNPEFIADQASMKPARPGSWTIELAGLSGECMNALGAIQAASDALALEAGLANKAQLVSRRTSPRL